MRLKVVAGALALAAAVTAAPAMAQDMKIGVVNLPRLLSESPQAQRARSNMEEQFSSRKEELEAKREDLQDDVDRLKRDGAVMSQEAREKLEDSIRDQQRRLQMLQSEYQDDVQRAEQKEMEALRNDIRGVIEDVADDGNYDLIVGQGILYASDRVDITQKILERMNAGN